MAGKQIKWVSAKAVAKSMSEARPALRVLVVTLPGKGAPVPVTPVLLRHGESARVAWTMDLMFEQIGWELGIRTPAYGVK